MEKRAAVQRRRRPKNTVREKRPSPADQYASKALSRALDILECFADEQTALSLKEISTRNELPESSVFRTLVALESRGYLAQEHDGTYRLTPRLLYGKVRERAERLRDIARPLLQDLSAQFNETASLSYLFEDRIQVIDTVETLHAMRLTNRPGRVLPPHCSSMGKSITAFQPPEKIKHILEVYGLIRRTPHTITDSTRLFAEFARIREQGYAFDREESIEGGFCVGAPIRREGRPVVAAFSLSTPMVRFSPELEAAVVKAVKATANAIAAVIE